MDVDFKAIGLIFWKHLIIHSSEQWPEDKPKPIQSPVPEFGSSATPVYVYVVVYSALDFLGWPIPPQPWNLRPSERTEALHPVRRATEGLAPNNTLWPFTPALSCFFRGLGKWRHNEQQIALESNHLCSRELSFVLGSRTGSEVRHYNLHGRWRWILHNACK